MIAYLTWHRTLLVNRAGLEHAKALVARYKQGKIGEMNAELWGAKKIVDSTLHPGMSNWHREKWHMLKEDQIPANQFSSHFECHVSWYQTW